MMRFVTVGLLASLLSSFVISTGACSVPKEMLWFPVDGGLGFVPGFLNSAAAKGLVAPFADPADIHFYLYTK